MSAVRPDWLKAVVDASQQAAALCEQVDPDDAYDTLTAFVRSVPVPASLAERLALRAILLDVAWRCANLVHARASNRCPGNCTFLAEMVLERFWRASRHDPRRAFTGWAAAFTSELARTHPSSPAERAARTIRDQYNRPWSLATLARRFNVTPSQLRRNFQREFGMTVREYQRTMRLIEALPQVPTEKIDAIALKVGYKSKKNFYRAFQSVTGLTPTAFRNLPRERAIHIAESIRIDPPRRAKPIDRRQRAGTLADRA